MKRRHRMPFGANVEASGAVQFSLWAPAARRVELRLQNESGVRDIRMTQQPGGWFSLDSKAAQPGDFYCYVIDGGQTVPDPASRYQPQDVHGPSMIVDPTAFEWDDADWNGRPWEETVLYELHVGTFTPEGTYAAAAEKLPYLAELGITAVELMPLAEAPGGHNWGYDGVHMFAPEARYGPPDDLKRFICAAHRCGLMVFLDVVYNHFGPEGNYLWTYAPQFFTERHHTPWGAAINFDGDMSRAVRDFYIHNALYWLEEFNFDGLRFDAVHAIIDDSGPQILTELAREVRGHLQRDNVHLVLENDDNRASLLERSPHGEPVLYDAQWNDDIHHVLHVLTTGEIHGYYCDYDADPGADLARALIEGFVYQGERSRHRDGRNRGEPSSRLPPTAFVSFLQNHDQIGNRPLGDRITKVAPPAAVRAAAATVLLAPSIPMLFMGEEWGSEQPFYFFCDFEPDLAGRVRKGRREEFVHFFQAVGHAASEIPDPTAPETFEASVLNWRDQADEAHAAWLRFYRDLLGIRHRRIIPHLKEVSALSAVVLGARRRVVSVAWMLGEQSRLSMLANFDAHSSRVAASVEGETLYTSHPDIAANADDFELPAWYFRCSIVAGHRE